MTSKDFFEKYNYSELSFYDLDLKSKLKLSPKISYICEQMGIIIKQDNEVFTLLGDCFGDPIEYSYDIFLSDYEQYRIDEANKINCLENVEEAKKCVEIYNLFGFEVILDDEMFCGDSDRKFSVFYNKELVAEYFSANSCLFTEQTVDDIKKHLFNEGKKCGEETKINQILNILNIKN